MWHQCYSISRSLRKNLPICSSLLCSANTNTQLAMPFAFCAYLEPAVSVPNNYHLKKKKEVCKFRPLSEITEGAWPLDLWEVPFTAQRNIRPSLWGPKEEYLVSLALQDAIAVQLGFFTWNLFFIIWLKNKPFRQLSRTYSSLLNPNCCYTVNLRKGLPILTACNSLAELKSSSLTLRKAPSNEAYSAEVEKGVPHSLYEEQ